MYSFVTTAEFSYAAQSQVKRPRSSLFAQSQGPDPSHNSSLMRLCEALQKTKTCPLSGFSGSYRSANASESEAQVCYHLPLYAFASVPEDYDTMKRRTDLARYWLERHGKPLPDVLGVPSLKAIDKILTAPEIAEIAKAEKGAVGGAVRQFSGEERAEYPPSGSIRHSL